MPTTVKDDGIGFGWTEYWAECSDCSWEGPLRPRAAGARMDAEDHRCPGK